MKTASVRRRESLVLALRGLTLLLALACPWGRAFAAAEDEESKPVNLWPVFVKKADKDYLDVEVLFSLLSYTRDGRKLDLAIRPLYWRSTDRSRDYARTDVLWPLATRIREGDKRSLRVLPLFYQKRTPPEFYSLLFPLYHYTSETDRWRLGVIGFIPFTVFDFEHDYERDRTHHRYIIWTYDRSAEQVNINLAPLYTQQTAPGQGSITMLPLFADAWHQPTGYHRVSFIGFSDYFNLAEYRRDPPKKLVEGHFLVFWKKRMDLDYRTIFFPVYWHSKSGADTSLFFWPVFGRRERGTAVEYSTIWPLFSFERDAKEKETDIGFLWPLGRDYSVGTRREARFLPLFSWISDPKTHEEPGLVTLALSLPLPLSYRAVGADFHYHRVFYIAWITENKDAVRNVVFNHYLFKDKASGTIHQGFFPIYHGSRWDKSALDVVLPLFGSYRRPDFRFETLLPLYWRYASSDTATGVLFPFYFSHESALYGMQVVFPFYYHSLDRKLGTELNYYFPLYGTYRRGDVVTRRLLFFPLYSRLYDPALGLRSLDVLWPFFHVDSGPDASSTRVLPFYWRADRPERSFRIAFPLYWDYATPQTRHRYLFPFYGSYARADELSLSVFGPFYWDVRRPRENYRRSDFLLALYSRAQAGDEVRSHLLPLYWRWTSPEQDARYLPPLAGYHRMSDGYRNLFLLGINRSVNLFDFERAPRYNSRSDRALLYYSREDRTSAFTTLFPLYWKWRDPEETGHILFPLFGKHEDLAAGSWDVSVLGLPEGFSLLEFGGERQRDAESSRWLLFYHGREGRDYTTVFFPLFWDRRSPPYSRSQLFPFYAYKRDDQEGEKRFGILGVTPRISFYSWSDTPLDKTNRLWPLFSYGRDKKEDEVFLSLLGVQREISLFRASRRREDVSTSLFPLYGYERRGHLGERDYYRETKVLWRLYYNGREVTGRSDFRLLYRFRRVYNAPDESAFELNPFYFSVRHGGSTYRAILGGLFGVETRADGTHGYTFFWVF